LPTDQRASDTSIEDWHLADLDREKRRFRDKFDLTTAVHKAEYDTVKKPIGKKSGKPIEPAHKFEINLEGDNFTKEKFVNTIAFGAAS
jgi:hypothetical protein